MAGTAGEQCALRQGSAQIPCKGTRIQAVVRRIEPVRRGIEYRLGCRGAQPFFANLTCFQRLVDGGDRLASVTLYIQAGNHADLLRHRLDVDARDLSRWEQQSAFGRVVAKLSAYAEYEIGISQQLLRRRRCERARNADVPGMSGKIAFTL